MFVSPVSISTGFSPEGTFSSDDGLASEESVPTFLFSTVGDDLGALWKPTESLKLDLKTSQKSEIGT